MKKPLWAQVLELLERRGQLSTQDLILLTSTKRPPYLKLRQLEEDGKIEYDETSEKWRFKHW